MIHHHNSEEASIRLKYIRGEPCPFIKGEEWELQIDVVCNRSENSPTPPMTYIKNDTNICMK